MAGEFDLIEWICARSERSERVVVPPGDDLAALTWAGEDLLLLGVDQVLDGVHFDSAVHTPREIGRKAMNRNLSDCAAMGCLPAAALATVALPTGTPMEYARELYLGLRDAGDPFDCPVVGGDTASWGGKLVVTVSIVGRSAGVTPVTRKGAKPGDGIYVTGPLGGSILGRHMTFPPRVEIGRDLARSGLVTAMIDLSDGLSRDLPHICKQSGVGAVIESARVPVHGDAEALSGCDKLPGLYHALHDGEDYELLFTARGTPTIGIRVGTVVEGEGISDERGQPIRPAGWEHRL